MKIAVIKEDKNVETRVSLIPEMAEKLVKLGAEVFVEKGLGETVLIADEAYEKVKATVVADRKALISDADLVLGLRKPEPETIESLKKGATWISFLDPFNNRNLVDAFRDKGCVSISMEMIPRTTRAQKMDALSSQANLGGYAAVIKAAAELNKAFPMMMTAAGTLLPSRVFVIGVGVAGLQAIATAKRLGARVEAFDTRPVVEEQVKSLGARFVKIDLGETGQTKQGYATALTPEQLEMQRKGMAKVCGYSDIVITTAQLFGRKAPVILTGEMVGQMSPGSVIVDMAVDSGGNVEGSKPGQTVEVNGVKIIGVANLPGEVPMHSSQVYANNLFNLIEEFWDKERKEFVLDPEDEILQGCVLTRDGQIVNAMLNKIYAEQDKK